MEYKFEPIDPKIYIGADCIICGEPVDLTDDEKIRIERGHYAPCKVCDECKKAILYMRKHIVNPEVLKEN